MNGDEHYPLAVKIARAKETVQPEGPAAEQGVACGKCGVRQPLQHSPDCGRIQPEARIVEGMERLATGWEADSNHKGFNDAYRAACNHHASALRNLIADDAESLRAEQWECVAWQRRIKHDSGRWLPWDYFSEAVDYDNDPSKFPNRIGRWECEYRELRTPADVARLPAKLADAIYDAGFIDEGESREALILTLAAALTPAGGGGFTPASGETYSNTDDVPDNELREQLSACRDDWQRVCDAIEPGQHLDPDDVILRLAKPASRDGLLLREINRVLNGDILQTLLDVSNGIDSPASASIAASAVVRLDYAKDLICRLATTSQPSGETEYEHTYDFKDAMVAEKSASQPAGENNVEAS